MARAPNLSTPAGGPIAIIISSTAQWEVGIVTFRNQLVHQTGSDITSMA